VLEENADESATPKKKVWAALFFCDKVVPRLLSSPPTRAWKQAARGLSMHLPYVPGALFPTHAEGGRSGVVHRAARDKICVYERPKDVEVGRGNAGAVEGQLAVLVARQSLPVAPRGSSG